MIEFKASIPGWFWWFVAVWLVLYCVDMAAKIWVAVLHYRLEKDMRKHKRDTQ